MKNVLITGGTRGIGRAMVELFSECGYSVAFTYKNSEDEAREIERKFRAVAIRADSALESDVIAAVSTAKERLGGIDILVNNAGICAFSVFTEITLAEWRNMMAVNLDAAFLYSREVIPQMLVKKWGRIINISSMWGLVGSSCEVHYSTAKAALIGMTKALAKELGPSGITVNAIAPGVIDTDMNKMLSAEDMAMLEDETPVSRIGNAREVAEAALFLAGEGAGFITGDVLNISGGFVV